MRMLGLFATGDWLTRSRVRLFACLVLAMTVGCTGWLVLTGHGTLDATGRPIGTDFSNVYAAGWMADHGEAAAAWDWPRHYAAQQAIHGSRSVPFYGWHYPPPFLLLAALLAWLPYFGALAAWQAASLAMALASARRILPDQLTLLAGLGLPATFVCLGHGQNGFLTAALLGFGLLLLDRRPWIAGALLGCLIYKPQFAPVLPLLLLAGGRWRAIGGASASAAALVAATVGIWGTGVWQAFFSSLTLTRDRVIEGMETGAYKIVSPFAAVRLNGGGIEAAYLVQAIAAGLALGSVLIAARAGLRVRAAVAIAAAFLATPYVFDYDMVALGIATAFLIAEARETGWRPYEKSAVALLLAAPLFGRQAAELTGVPVNLFAIVIFWLLATRRAVEGLPSRRTWFSGRTITPSPSRR